MRHYQEFVADQTATDVANDQFRQLRLSQTLGIAILLAFAAFVLMAATGTSWLVSGLAAIAVLNVVPLLLGVVLSVIK